MGFVLLLRCGSSANVDPATRFATVACDAVRSDTIGRFCRCDPDLGEGGGNKVLPHEATAEHARQGARRDRRPAIRGTVASIAHRCPVFVCYARRVSARSSEDAEMAAGMHMKLTRQDGNADHAIDRDSAVGAASLQYHWRDSYLSRGSPAVGSMPRRSMVP